MDTKTQLAALEYEKAGYLARGAKDKAALVDEEIRRVTKTAKAETKVEAPANPEAPAPGPETAVDPAPETADSAAKKAAAAAKRAAAAKKKAAASR